MCYTLIWSQSRKRQGRSYEQLRTEASKSERREVSGLRGEGASEGMGYSEAGCRGGESADKSLGCGSGSMGKGGGGVGEANEVDGRVYGGARGGELRLC
jgi:hypothetical protein